MSNLDVEELLANITPQVQEAVTKQSIETISRSLSYSLDQKAQLKADHETMVTGIVTAVHESVNVLRDKMVERMTNNLDGYKLDKVIKAVFGGQILAHDTRTIPRGHRLLGDIVKQMKFATRAKGRMH